MGALFPDSLACFLSTKSPNELRTPTNASELIRIDLDSVKMSKNTLQTCYELVTDVLNREFVAKILNRSRV